MQNSCDYTYFHNPPVRLEEISRAVARGASLWTLRLPQPSGAQRIRETIYPQHNAATGNFFRDALLDF